MQSEVPLLPADAAKFRTDLSGRMTSGSVGACCVPPRAGASNAWYAASPVVQRWRCIRCGQYRRTGHRRLRASFPHVSCPIQISLHERWTWPTLSGARCACAALITAEHCAASIGGVSLALCPSVNRVLFTAPVFLMCSAVALTQQRPAVTTITGHAAKPERLEANDARAKLSLPRQTESAGRCQ